MIKHLLILPLSLLYVSLSAQEIEITQLSLKDSKAVINYNLKDDKTERRYTLNLYSSKDNFIIPLENVNGDIGLEVKPGYNKKITWDIGKEYGSDYKGQISLELRGRVYVEFVNVEGFETYRTVKRGKPWDILWRGGAGSRVLTFELYDGEVPTEVVFPNVANEGNVTINIPTSVKPGKDYRFKISDKRNKDDVVFTDPFRIKRKIPLLAKIVPVFVVGVLVGTVAGSSSGGETPEDNSGFEDPILPGN